MKKIIVMLFILVSTAYANECGNDVCDVGENCRNCPWDCNCPANTCEPYSGYFCEQNTLYRCRLHEIEDTLAWRPALQEVCSAGEMCDAKHGRCYAPSEEDFEDDVNCRPGVYCRDDKVVSCGSVDGVLMESIVDECGTDEICRDERCVRLGSCGDGICERDEICREDCGCEDECEPDTSWCRRNAVYECVEKNIGGCRIYVERLVTGCYDGECDEIGDEAFCREVDASFQSQPGMINHLFNQSARIEQQTRQTYVKADKFDVIMDQSPTGHVFAVKTCDCIVDENCFGRGQQFNGKFCGTAGLQDLKAQNATCQNDYECNSQTCLDGTCDGEQQDIGILDQIITWLQNLFQQ